MSDVDQAPTFAVGWRGAVGGVVCLAAAVGTGIVWSSDSAERTVGDGSAAVASGAVTGEDLFRAKGCAGCHLGPDAETDSTGMAPDLSDVSAWAGQRRPGMSAEDYVAESIRDPGAFTSPAFRPGNAGPMDAMPDLEVSEPEIQLIVAYLLQQDP